MDIYWYCDEDMNEIAHGTKKYAGFHAFFALEYAYAGVHRGTTLGNRYNIIIMYRKNNAVLSDGVAEKSG